MHLDERRAFVEELRSGGNAFVDAVSGVSETQAKFKTSPDRWSIEEVVEHVAVAEHGMYRLITAYSEPWQEPSDPKREIEIKEMALHGEKRKAPPGVLPKGRFASFREAVERFRDNRERTIAYIGACDADLRALCVQHPVGRITAQECLILLTSHPLRHVQQILAIRQSPGYPA